MIEDRGICEYCAGWTLPDSRGNCSGCGAPKKPSLLDYTRPGTIWHIDADKTRYTMQRNVCISTSAW